MFTRPVKPFAAFILTFTILSYQSSVAVLHAEPVGSASWNVGAASAATEKQETKPYTLMVYMNGSDLESEEGAATDDLIEMLESGLDSHNAHLIVLTGGANRWQNDIVPANECVLWEIADGWLYKIAGIGDVNMGDPGTLCGFIQYGLKNFPAEKYGLIMWDHGGGSIVGYGFDEKYEKGNLTLADMRYAFQQSGLNKTPLEFLGFDSCLMATVEMARVAADYTKYLIASEDLEPADGWDYHFLSILNHDPQADGKTLGVGIVDYFMSYYGPRSDEVLTLSVIDLSKTAPVMSAMGHLTALCTESLRKEPPASFRVLSGKRSRTKTFGEGGPLDQECDMVDIGDMAVKLFDLYPAEAAAVLAALDDCVVYNRHNSYTDLRGVSTYYVYGGKSVGRSALDTYAALNLNANYTRYLYRFFSELTGEESAPPPRFRSRVGADIQEAADVTDTELALWYPVAGSRNLHRLAGLNAHPLQTSGPKDPARTVDPAGYGTALSRVRWPKLNGQSVCLYPIGQTAQNQRYAIPAQVNGRDCDLIVLCNEAHPEGFIEGVRNSEGIIVQKGHESIKTGDSVALYYMDMEFDVNGKGQYESWKLSRAFTAAEPLQLTWETADAEAEFGLRMTDLRADIGYFLDIAH